MNLERTKPSINWALRGRLIQVAEQAILSLRKQYKASLDRPPLYFNNYLLIFRRSLADFGAITRNLKNKTFKSKLSLAGTWSRDTFMVGCVLKGLSILVREGEHEYLPCRGYTARGVAGVGHGGKARDMSKTLGESYE